MAGSTTKKAPAKKAAASTPTPEEQAKAERQALLREAYTAASSRVRQAHESEFFDYYEEEAKKRGVSYSRPKSPAQRAEEQLVEIVKANPDLAFAYGFSINEDGEPVRLDRQPQPDVVIPVGSDTPED